MLSGQQDQDPQEGRGYSGGGRGRMGSRTGRALASNDIIAGNGTALKNVYVGTPNTLSPYSFHIGVNI